MVAWLTSVVIAMTLWVSHMLHEFFIAIPLWFVSAGIYIGLASVAGARTLVPGLDSKSEVKQPQIGEKQLRNRKTRAPRTAGLYAVGIIAWISLIASVALPTGLVYFGAVQNQKWPSWYLFTLTTISIVHLTSITMLVVLNERRKEIA